MEILAGMVVLVGNWCYLAELKSIVAIGIWISSIFTGTLAVLSTIYRETALLKATLISAFILCFCMEIGFWGLYKWFKKNTPQ